jgi:glutamine amidotransferase
MIAIVDYGAGNATSVALAFAAAGADARITRDPGAVRRADRVVFPGVGAARSAMDALAAARLDGAVREAADSGRPFLGICLGMQILFGRSDEDGGVDTLGVLPGRVRRFPSGGGFKVPAIGWNQVRTRGAVPGVPDGAEFYFVHSYYAEPGAFSEGLSEYAGVAFASFVRRDRLWACQFHPEKSGRVGLGLLKWWLSC